MTSNNPGAAIIWGLDTGRTGESSQVRALCLALALPFEMIPLPAHGALPAPLPATPPALIISFGRSARMALTLRDKLPTRPLLVHLGTPGQLPNNAFDLIIPMPQDAYPPAANVLPLRLPLNGASCARTTLPERGNGTGGTIILLGGKSRHFRLTRGAVHHLIRFATRLANANKEPLQIITSPRTPDKILNALRRLQAQHQFALRLYGDGAAPFAHYLANAARLIVTADSASMVADACRTGAPVWLFPLPLRPNVMTFLQQTSDRCLGPGFRHHLVRQGIIGGGTDYASWHRALARSGYIRIARHVPDTDLTWAPPACLPDTDLTYCATRALRLLGLNPPAPNAISIQSAAANLTAPHDLT